MHIYDVYMKNIKRLTPSKAKPKFVDKRKSAVSEKEVEVYLSLAKGIYSLADAGRELRLPNASDVYRRMFIASIAYYNGDYK